MESTPNLMKEICETFDNAIINDNLIFNKGTLFVPDANNLCICLVQNQHNLSVTGHYGTIKTLDLISRDYFFVPLLSALLNPVIFVNITRTFNINLLVC